MVLLISYDLNRHERPSAYRAVEDVIKRHALATVKPLYSQWLVETDDSVRTWAEWIRAVIDQDDRLLVLQVRGAVDGWLDTGIFEWINARVPGAST